MIVQRTPAGRIHRLADSTRLTIKLVALGLALAGLLGSCFLPAPGYKRGITRDGLVPYLDQFRLPSDATSIGDRYVGTDQCRVYQWLQFRCEDTNFLERTIALHDPAPAICERILAGELGLARPPDEHESGRQQGEPTCYFRYNISSTDSSSLSVGGQVAPHGPTESALILSASSWREP